MEVKEEISQTQECKNKETENPNLINGQEFVPSKFNQTKLIFSGDVELNLEPVTQRKSAILVQTSLHM